MQGNSWQDLLLYLFYPNFQEIASFNPKILPDLVRDCNDMACSLDEHNAFIKGMFNMLHEELIERRGYKYSFLIIEQNKGMFMEIQCPSCGKWYDPRETEEVAKTCPNCGCKNPEFR